MKTNKTNKGKYALKLDGKIDENSYILRDNHDSVWIQVGNAVVHIYNHQHTVSATIHTTNGILENEPLGKTEVLKTDIDKMYNDIKKQEEEENKS